MAKASVVCRSLVVLPLALSACLSRKLDDFIAGLEVTEGASSGSSGETSSSGESSSGAPGDASSESGTSGSGDAADSSPESGSSETADTTGSSSEGSTDEPPPAVCGDGVVADEEECDDNNNVPYDGCTDCTVDIRAFVSSMTHKAGDLGSVHLADARCLQRAYDGNLADPLNFRAWLSSSEQDARDRFDRTRRGPIVMINGLPLAAGWPELLAGVLDNPLEVTELSTTYHGAVWTGTKPDGTAADSDHCLDWTSKSSTKDAYYGYSDEISFEWTYADQFDNPIACDLPLSIYCFDSL